MFDLNIYHETHWGDLSCATCHSQDYKSCNSCHAGEGLAEPSYLSFKIGNQWVRTKHVKIPARPMAPLVERGMPKDWERVIQNSIIRRWKRETMK